MKLKLKYKVYKISEIELKSTGKKFEIKGRMLPYGTPLYGVYNLDGKCIYPEYFDILKDGERKESCERWIKSSCWHPEDKPFRIKLLEKIIALEAGKKLDNLQVISNDLVYEGNRHADLSLVFQEQENYFTFPYYENESGFFHIGRWMGKGLQINQHEYLCKRVYPHKKQITITEFKICKEVNNEN